MFWQRLPQSNTVAAPPSGMVSDPGAAESSPPAPAYQAPLVPHAGGARLMLDPLMSSMSVPVAGPLQKLAPASVPPDVGQPVPTALPAPALPAAASAPLSGGQPWAAKKRLASSTHWYFSSLKYGVMWSQL